MDLPHFEHHYPKKLEELLELIAAYRSSAKIVAGGTDLLIKMRGGVASPEHLVSINNVEELRGVDYDDRNGLVIGGAARITDVGQHPDVRKHYPGLTYACDVMATVQVRNMATVAGNLANAAPSADTAPPLLVHDADLVLVKSSGKRQIKLSEFFTGPGMTVIEPQEVIKSIRVPAPPDRCGSSYMRLSARSKVDIVAVSVAGLLTLSANGEIETACISLAAVAPIPLLVQEASDMLIGKKPSEELFSRVAAAAKRACKPIDDVRATAAYRRGMVEVLTRRVLADCLAKAEGGNK
jgi:CO/xanthine dehydrogenase FAD-binding subunit